MKKQGHIEIVRSRNTGRYTASGFNHPIVYHVRVRAANGRILMSSELYNRSATAKKCALMVGNITRIYTVDETGD